MKWFILVALFGLGLAQHNPHTKKGRTAMVHLFEWRWADIAAECERFLGPNGFGGVQVGDIVLLYSLSQETVVELRVQVETDGES